MEWFRKAIDLGAADGMNALGVCLLWGKGVGEDLQGALEEFEKAAELGNVLAMVNLGHCHYWGFGADKNPNAAVEWYSKAADLGSVYGMYYLGNCHGETIGARKRSELSSQWSRNPEEQEMLMGPSMSPVPISKKLGMETEKKSLALQLPKEAEG
ncbi:MAG: sel1 repeat family protein [Proteobacteria bacterium]|nr:sel1 repeat family protein [Pseudomonadota bacterium]